MRPQSLCTATNIFLVVSMIWFSYTNKLYIKMMEYSWEIDWNFHHQHFLFKIYRKQWKWHACTWNLFSFLAQPTAEPNWAECLPSSCWRSPRCLTSINKQSRLTWLVKKTLQNWFSWKDVMISSMTFMIAKRELQGSNILLSILYLNQSENA